MADQPSSAPPTNDATPVSTPPSKPTAASEPVKCIKGCGFFGNAACEGMCSKCYKEDVAARKARGEVVLTPEEKAAAAAAQAAAAAKPTKPVQTDKMKCWKCQRAIPLTSVACRCGYLFCAKHRYAEKHNCDFDYQEAARAELVEKNPEMRDKHHFTRIDSMESL